MNNNEQDSTLPRRSTLRISAADMAALKVRIRGRHRPDPPDFFYQSLPPEGAVLLSTIPCGEFAVSIPAGESSWRGGWPFTATLPESPVGPTVIYRLQSDCRYTAVAVLEDGRNYALEEFIEIAGCRMRNQFGNSKFQTNPQSTIHSRQSPYVYAAPDKEEWGDILRDEGYAALNPANPQSTIHNSQFTNVHIRAPLFSGDKSSLHAPLPVFSRVEVLWRDSGESRWLDFEDYKKARAGLAVIPGEITACFSEWLACLTEESGFDRWRFRPGMAFGERTEWWGLRCRRRTVHEGLDFVEGFRDGEVSLIPEGVPVRAVASGEVVATLDDFMGKTIVVRHPLLVRPGGDIFHTLLSHIQTEGLTPSFVKKGEILGRVGRRAGIRIRPHLHFTGAWFPAGFTFAKAGIETIIHPGFTPAILVDFNNLVEKSPLCLMSPDDSRLTAAVASG